MSTLTEEEQAEVTRIGADYLVNVLSLHGLDLGDLSQETFHLYLDIFMAGQMATQMMLEKIMPKEVK